MKIAIVAPLIEAVPPVAYGGTERVVHVLTEELVNRGHEVTLFATGDSRTNARLISVYPRGLRESFPNSLDKRNTYTHLHLSMVYKMQDSFDVIHDHTGVMGAIFASFSKTPVVRTLHTAINNVDRDIYAYLYEQFLVPISESQKKTAPGLGYTEVVYNGLDFTGYPFTQSYQDYLLYVGRIAPQKGVHFAIETAQKTNLPLIIAAKYEEALHKDYFANKIKPHLKGKIQWVGEVNEKIRNELFSHALASLHPVTWPEPFGLTLIEAMRCGSPVIAFNKGSIPEVVKNNKTGYVVNSVDEMVSAVAKLHKIDRRNCYQHAVKHFTAKQMTDGYEAIYNRAINTHRTPLLSTFGVN